MSENTTAVEFDVNTATMDELVAKHNSLLLPGEAPVEGFKSLKAARAAVEKQIAEAAAGEKTEGTVQATVSTEGAKNTGAEKRGPVQGVGKRAKELIVAGLDNKAVLAKIAEEFPTAKTSYACIAYYRNALKKAVPAATTEASVEAPVEAGSETIEATA